MGHTHTADIPGDSYRSIHDKSRKKRYTRTASPGSDLQERKTPSPSPTKIDKEFEDGNNTWCVFLPLKDDDQIHREREKTVILWWRNIVLGECFLSLYTNSPFMVYRYMSSECVDLISGRLKVKSYWGNNPEKKLFIFIWKPSSYKDDLYSDKHLAK